MWSTWAQHPTENTPTAHRHHMINGLHSPWQMEKLLSLGGLSIGGLRDVDAIVNPKVYCIIWVQETFVSLLRLFQAWLLSPEEQVPSKVGSVIR